jgi:hypothetical protein
MEISRFTNWPLYPEGWPSHRDGLGAVVQTVQHMLGVEPRLHRRTVLFLSNCLIHKATAMRAVTERWSTIIDGFTYNTGVYIQLS